MRDDKEKDTAPRMAAAAALRGERRLAAAALRGERRLAAADWRAPARPAILCRIMHEPRLLIIADDFTGANDTGVQVRRCGFPVRVSLSPAGITGGETAVLDTESRALPPAAAAQKIAACCASIPFERFPVILKKVDSTLRGNVGAETAALADSVRADCVIFAPALPGLGRTTVNGVHLLKGVPLTQTELARDPKTPVREDNITRIMEAAFGQPVRHFGLNEVRSGSLRLAGARIFTFDAETDADMRLIARAGLAAARPPPAAGEAAAGTAAAGEGGKRVLWVGSAALAESILAAYTAIPPALGIVASLSSVSRAQARYAEKQGTALVQVSVSALLEAAAGTAAGEAAGTAAAGEAAAGEAAAGEAAAGEAAASIAGFAEAAVALLAEGRDCLVVSSSTYTAGELEKADAAAARLGMGREALGDWTALRMGEIALSILRAPALRKTGVSGIFLAGGDTAIRFFNAAGAEGSRIETEIAAGIPFMRLAGGPFDGLKVITKAGAFGAEDAIFYSLRKLKEQALPPSTKEGL